MISRSIKQLINGYGTALKLIEELSETMDTPKEDDRYQYTSCPGWRNYSSSGREVLQSDLRGWEYTLEKMELYHPQIKIIDSESNS